METRKRDIIKIVIIGLVITWIICFFIDYIRARQQKMPIFCVKEVTTTYDDGEVQTCIGLGYKMIKYQRTSIPVGIDFGPFFIKERTK